MSFIDKICSLFIKIKEKQMSTTNPIDLFPAPTTPQRPITRRSSIYMAPPSTIEQAAQTLANAGPSPTSSPTFSRKRSILVGGNDGSAEKVTQVAQQMSPFSPSPIKKGAFSFQDEDPFSLLPENFFGTANSGVSKSTQQDQSPAEATQTVANNGLSPLSPTRSPRKRSSLVMSEYEGSPTGAAQFERMNTTQPIQLFQSSETPPRRMTTRSASYATSPSTPERATQTLANIQLSPQSPVRTPRKRSCVVMRVSGNMGSPTGVTQVAGPTDPCYDSPVKKGAVSSEAVNSLLPEITGRGKPKNTKKPPPAPLHQNRRKAVTSVPLTGHMLRNKNRFLKGEAAWNKISAKRSIGEGSFHTVYELDDKRVIKIPNEVEITKSKNMIDKTPICFVRVENGLKNYEALQRAKQAGKIPAMLHFADTEFDVELAIITQEKWHRPFIPERDLKDPNVVATIKAVLQLLKDRKIPDMDFRPDNLGWTLVQTETGGFKSVLKLFDFLEETDNESVYTITQFAKQFAEGDQDLYDFIMPK
jgi:hypothetical protein